MEKTSTNHEDQLAAGLQAHLPSHTFCVFCLSCVSSKANPIQGWKQRGGDKGGAKNHKNIMKNKAFHGFSGFVLVFAWFSWFFLKVFSLKFPPLSPQTVFSDVKRQNPLIPPLVQGEADRLSPYLPGQAGGEKNKVLT